MISLDSAPREHHAPLSVCIAALYACPLFG